MSIRDAKAWFSAPLTVVEAGDEVVIARTPRAMTGRIWISRNFIYRDEQFRQGFV